ncbi:MAG: hypothetical protein HDR49_05790 [Bacteroides sp.]|nr:hypothetical protein [Bacteroides sp.]
MKKSLMLIAAVSVASGAFTVSAQRDVRVFEENVVTVVVNEQEADPADVEKAFKTNAPNRVRDNGLPRFAIVGKDHKFYLGIGAQFLGEGVFDWGANVPSTIDFDPSALTPATPGNGSNLGFGWQSSNIHMNIVAMPHTANQLGIFFKAKFTGPSNGFHVSHFYAKYRGLTAGYTNSLFTDGAAEPFTIDDEGPAGIPDITLFTAYWEQKFTNNFSGAIGIDAPTASLTTGDKTATVNQRIPAIPLYLQYGWQEGKGHIRLSGLIRPLQYRNLVKDKNATLVGAGVQLSGMTPIAGGLSAQFNATYGSGISKYIQDDSDLGLDAVASTTDGKMKMVRTMGLTAGLTYNISRKVSTNVSYSHVTNWFGDSATSAADAYRNGDYVAANVVYAINKYVSAGLEYDYGHRSAVDGSSLHANRIQCQFAVTF